MEVLAVSTATRVARGLERLAVLVELAYAALRGDELGEKMSGIAISESLDAMF